MTEFHNEVLKRIQHVGCSGSGFAASSAGTSNFIQISSANEVGLEYTNISTTMVMVKRDEKITNTFYSSGEAVLHLLERFVLPAMLATLLVTSWFCGNQSTGTNPLNF